MWKFIGVSGPIGAGKTTLCTILIERGYKYLSFGKLVEDIVKKERAIYSRRELQDRGEELIRDLGYPGIVNLLFEKNKVDKASNYVVDGIRHLEVYRYFRHIFGDSFGLIFVEAPLHVRLERIRGRSVKDSGITSPENLTTMENRDIERNVDDLKKYADLIIKNVSDRIYLERVIDDFLKLPK